MSSEMAAEKDGPVARIGSRVRVRDQFGEEEFTIVPDGRRTACTRGCRWTVPWATR
jgi:hypothetical protein